MTYDKEKKSLRNGKLKKKNNNVLPRCNAVAQIDTLEIASVTDRCLCCYRNTSKSTSYNYVLYLNSKTKKKIQIFVCLLYF